MKKTILVVGLVVGALVVLGVGVAFAQGPAPFAGNGPMLQNGGGYLHTYMVTAFAEKLGLKVDDVNARLAAGETMYNIAVTSGVKAEDFPSLMIEVRTNALSLAVKAGVLIQAQADWMSSRGFGRGGMGYGNNGDGCLMQDGTGAGYGPGMMQGNGRGMGRGFGWQNQQTNP
jgi:hypothetical protein